MQDLSWGAGVNPDAVLSYVILVTSYAWKVGGIFDFACSAYCRWVRHPIDWIFECLLVYTARKLSLACTQNSVNRLGWLIVYRLAVTLWLPYVAIFETLASFSMAIWVSCLGLVFGTIQIVVPRKQNLSTLGADEDIWGFGQLVPLILLIQPLSVVWEHLVIAKSTNKQEHEHGEHVTITHEKTSRAALEVATPDPALEPSDVQPQRPPAILLQHTADYRPVKPSRRIHNQSTSIGLILMKSRVFHAIVWLTQPAMLLATVFVFAFDTSRIGTLGTFNWAIACWVFADFMILAWLVTFCLMPWSTLGRVPAEWRPTLSCTAISGRMEDGMGYRQDVDVLGHGIT